MTALNTSFNPLHCGAVVASIARMRADGYIFRVSIPFIAGQWSLLATDRVRGCTWAFRFNPLHCGAVVASRSPHGGGAKEKKSFNPLHCGAVVASEKYRATGKNVRGVSIPFIAGQWSLLRAGARGQRLISPLFQSPSLRGSGRFQ